MNYNEKEDVYNAALSVLKLCGVEEKEIVGFEKKKLDSQIFTPRNQLLLAMMLEKEAPKRPKITEILQFLGMSKEESSNFADDFRKRIAALEKNLKELKLYKTSVLTEHTNKLILKGICRMICEKEPVFYDFLVDPSEVIKGYLWKLKEHFIDLLNIISFESVLYDKLNKSRFVLSLLVLISFFRFYKYLSQNRNRTIKY